MKNANKRKEIMQAALGLIAEHGFHRAPMTMIADKAGVGAGTIYRYFDSKDTLIVELYRELEEKLIAFLKEGYSTAKPIRERFLHIGTMLLKYFITNPLHFRYLEQYMQSPFGAALKRERLLGEIDEDYSLFMYLIREGISQQVLKDLPLPVHLALAFGPILILARDSILGFVILDDALILKTVEACWEGVKR